MFMLYALCFAVCFMYNCFFYQVTDDNGTIELYPIVFKVYKHSTLPANKTAKTGPWTAFLEIIGYIRTSSDTGVGSTGPALPGDSAQPILPRRVLYYIASFDKATTVQQVMPRPLDIPHPLNMPRLLNMPHAMRIFFLCL